ncbi:MAG: hypothetical protein ABWX96_21360 [Propionibacteriaceae bacterium]
MSETSWSAEDAEELAWDLLQGKVPAQDLIDLLQGPDVLFQAEVRTNLFEYAYGRLVYLLEGHTLTDPDAHEDDEDDGS